MLPAVPAALLQIVTDTFARLLLVRMTYEWVLSTVFKQDLSFGIRMGMELKQDFSWGMFVSRGEWFPGVMTVYQKMTAGLTRPGRHS